MKKHSKENINNSFYRNPKNFNLIFFVVIVILSFIVFGNGISGRFVADDHHIVEERADLKSLSNIADYFTQPAYPGQPWIGIYRPFTLLSYALNFVVSNQPAGFHILNIILHALNVFLIFLIAKMIVSKRVAVVSALLFLVLPIHVEIVTSIVGRSELLSVFFMLLSLLLFFKNKHFWASLVFFAALLSKDFSVYLLPLFGLLLLIKTRNFWSSVKIGVYYLIPVLAYFPLRYLALGKYAFGERTLDQVTAPLAFFSLKERIYTSFLEMFIYIKQTFYPVKLITDYSYNQFPPVDHFFSSYQPVIGLLIFLGFVALLIWGKEKIKIFSGMIVVSFIFISNMFLVTSGSFAERWWYFPSFSLLVLLAIGIEKIIEKYSLTKIPVLIVLIIFSLWMSFLTIKQNGVWLNDVDFYTYTAKVAPNNTWAKSNLAATYLAQRKYNEAKQEAFASLAIYKDFVPSLNILGLIYWHDYDFKSAEASFKRAITADPLGKNSRGLYRSLAFLNFDFGYSQEALKYMEEVIKSPPTRGDQETVRADQILYNTIKKNVGRGFSSYTAKEKEELGRLIILIRGF